jgi:hypothetical protein
MLDRFTASANETTRQDHGAQLATGEVNPSNCNRSFLFYVVDWLPPDFGAVGQYALIFAREQAQNRRNVCLIGLTTGESTTSIETYDDHHVFEIKRLSAKRYDKTGLISRLIWSCRANLRLCAAIAQDPRSRGATILFTGSPPFMLFFVFFLRWLRDARLIYRITDFYPEVLIAAWGKSSPALRLLQRAAWFLRRRVDAIEVLGEDQRQLLVAGGVKPRRITLKRDVAPVSFQGTYKEGKRPSELAGRLILLYSGNYGTTHEADTVISGFIRHHRFGNARFGLWLNASGSAVPGMVKQLRAARVPFAHTEPVELNKLASLMLSADAHLITLRQGFAGFVMPSKIYGCLQTGKSIVFVGPKSSDVHLLGMQAKEIRYEQVDPGDGVAFAEALDRLAAQS